MKNRLKELRKEKQLTLMIYRKRQALIEAPITIMNLGKLNPN